MANILPLTCLVEYREHVCYLDVPRLFGGRPVTVDDLRQLIFYEDNCEDFTRHYRNVTLLKINVDLDHCKKRFHQLRFNIGDNDVEELSPGQRIDEIWREPPPACRISVFAKCTDLFPQVAAYRRTLEDAQLVYDGLWGKNVNVLLQDVPGHGNLQYLPASQVDSLGLKRLCCPEILPVREDYKVLYNTLQSYWEDRVPLCGGVVVTGRPGIEKSYPLYYLLLCLLNEKKSVAFQVDARFVLFQDTGVQLYFATDMDGHLIPEKTWALTDFSNPCPAFITASKTKSALIVQSTNPIQMHELWTSWRYDCNVAMHEMEVMSSDELIALGV